MKWTTFLVEKETPGYRSLQGPQPAVGHLLEEFFHTGAVTSTHNMSSCFSSGS